MALASSGGRAYTPPTRRWRPHASPPWLDPTSKSTAEPGPPRPPQWEPSHASHPRELPSHHRHDTESGRVGAGHDVTGRCGTCDLWDGHAFLAVRADGARVRPGRERGD